MPLPSLAPISRADPLMLRLWQSGREIFHSNTLAFLIGDAKYGPCLLQQLTGDSGWNNYEVRTLREKWQLDILVIARKKPAHPSSPEPCAGNAGQVEAAFDDWRIVVIENKFKSLPDRGQLMRYTKKLDEQFAQTTPGNEGCNGQRSAGAMLLCELWRADSVDQADEPAERQPSGTDDAHDDENTTAEHTGHAGGSGKTLSNRQKVVGTLYRVVLQPTLANAPPTPCSSEPCGGCAAASTDCVEIDLSGTTGTLLTRNWRAVSYEDLLTCLPSPAARSASGSSSPTLTSLFIPAYRDLVDQTCNLHRTLHQYLQGKNSFADAVQLEAGARALGIWDFIDKWRYGWLAEKTKLKIRSHRLLLPALTLQFKKGQSLFPVLAPAEN